jgi:serine/threonine-protein kinase
MSDQLARLWPRAEAILDEVIDLPEPERSRRALAACRDDATLAQVLRELLHADATPAEILDKLPASLFLPADETVPAPDRIGPFRIAGEIGSGGMGTVLLGVRDDGTFEQRVAIKVIHHGLPGDDARETLVRERRILARLQHPDIARMYDGGMTASGEPYFVMEYVDGTRIDRYCDDHGLGVGDRVRLLARVCRAVEYAHGRLVVHCDLKPGNILVTHDGDVKLVDFGIAYLLEGERRGGVRSEPRALTPAYAAPEQERNEEVTAATDVYQLGVVLHELLTGAQGAAPAPLPDDLAAVIAKARRRDPKDRYPTVETLRRDLEAFLESRPVSAHPASSGYLFTKFVARHRMQVAAAATVLLSLLVGLIGVAAQSRVAAAERDRAKRAERRASAVNDFVLQELLRAPMPEASLGRDLTVAEVLGNAARSVGHAFEGEPRTEAEVRLALAHTYSALGRADDAAGHAAAARDLLARDASAPPSAHLAAERTIAEIEFERGNYGQARALLEELLDRQRRELGESDPESLATAASLGRVLGALTEYARAVALLRDAKAVAKKEHPGLWRLELDLDDPLVRAQCHRNENVEGERIAREMLDILERHVGPDHPERVTILTILANALNGQLRYVDAEAVAADAIASCRKIFGPDHPAMIDPLHSHALALERLGRYAESVADEDAAVAVAAKALGPEHPKTLFCLFSKAILTKNSGDLATAEPMLRAVVDARARVLGESNAETILAMERHNAWLAALGRQAEADTVARRIDAAYDLAARDPKADPGVLGNYAEFLMAASPASLQNPAKALSNAERAVGASARQNYSILRTLGEALEANGRRDDAIVIMQEALALPDGMRSWSTEERVIELLKEAGRAGEVPSFLEERIAAQRTSPGRDERMIAKSIRLLAIDLESSGKAAEAEARFREAEEILKRVVPADNWELGRIQSELGGCLAAHGKDAEAEPLLVAGAKILFADPPAKRWAAQARDRLVKFYEAHGRRADADIWRK